MKRLVLGILVAVMLMPVAAIAQDSNYSQERLQEVSKNSSLKLNDAQLDTVKKNCVAQKAILKNLQLDNDRAVRKRLIIYGGIQKELKALEIRISRQGADASELDLLIGKIDQQLGNINELSQKHSDLVDDLTAINCQENPLLFAMGVEELRNVRERLLDEAQSLRRSIIDAPNTTFLPLIERLLI
jgi:hypothetical protein